MDFLAVKMSLSSLSSNLSSRTFLFSTCLSLILSRSYLDQLNDDALYRKYAMNMDKALAVFETVYEWQDLASGLTRITKVSHFLHHTVGFITVELLANRGVPDYDGHSKETRTGQTFGAESEPEPAGRCASTCFGGV